MGILKSDGNTFLETKITIYLIVIYACRKHYHGQFNKERNQMILNHSLSQFSLRRCLQKGRNRDGLCLRSWTAGNYQRKLLRQNRTISLSEYHHLSSTYIVITVNNLYVGQSSKYDHLSFPSITKDYFFGPISDTSFSTTQFTNHGWHKLLMLCTIETDNSVFFCAFDKKKGGLLTSRYCCFFQQKLNSNNPVLW